MSSYHQRADHVARHPTSPKGALMEWSRYQVIKRRGKKKKKNPLHLHLAGRCDFYFGKHPPSPSPIQRRKSRTACMQSMLLGNAWEVQYDAQKLERKRVFHIRPDSSSSSHDVRIPFLEGGLSVFPRRWSNNGEIQLLADPYCRPDELACLHHYHHHLLHCGCSGTGRCM